MSAAEGVKALLRYATRGEIPVIQRLAIAAGVYWRCKGYNCSHVNENGENFCSAPGCHRPKP